MSHTPGVELLKLGELDQAAPNCERANAPLPSPPLPLPEHLQGSGPSITPTRSESAHDSDRLLNQRFLSVVIPAFNEELLIDRCLAETSQALLQFGMQIRNHRGR